MVALAVRIVYSWTSYGKSIRAWLVVFFLTSFLASASGEINPIDGYEWLEYPKGSGTSFVRDDGTKNWTLWEN